MLYVPCCPPEKSFSFAGSCPCLSLRVPLSQVSLEPFPVVLSRRAPATHIFLLSGFGCCQKHVCCLHPATAVRWSLQPLLPGVAWSCGGDSESALQFPECGDPGWWVAALCVTPQHVPCALWPAWLPAEFLETIWLGQKSSASWALRSHGEPEPGPPRRHHSLWWTLRQTRSSFPQPVPRGYPCVTVFVHRTVSLQGCPMSS